MADKVAKLEKPFVNRIVGSGVEQTDQLLANPRNWRVHYEAQQQALAGAIDEVGFIRSVTVNRLSGTIVDGHLRVILALRSGVAELPVEYVELSEEEEAKALLMLDPIASMAAADRAKLADLLGMVNSDDARVQAMLAELAEKEGVFSGNGHKADSEPQVDRAGELQQVWQTCTGQLWRIGEHRLLCGDSTKREDVERVMGGERAEMVFFDPPYGIDKAGIANDNNLCVYQSALNTSREFLENNSYLCVFGWVGFIAEMVNYAKSLNLEFVWICINHTPNTGSHGIPTGLGFNEWSPLLIFAKGNPRPVIQIRDYLKNTDQSEVSKSPHPTPKNVEFCSYYIERLSNGVVYDPTLGSGTTMVAAQNLGRRCRGIEISEGYCGVVLERMKTAFPGIQIELLERA